MTRIFLLYSTLTILLISSCGQKRDNCPLSDYAMYELRDNVKQCIVNTIDTESTLFSDTLLFSQSGKLIAETSFRYVYNPVTNLLTHVDMGNNINIPISISTDESFTIARGEVIVSSEFNDTLKYTFFQIRDSIGHLVGCRYEQLVKLDGEDCFSPGDFSIAAAYQWENNQLTSQYIDGGYYATHYTYYYNSDGYITRESATNRDEQGEWNAETTYRYSGFDKHGNWTRRTATTVIDSTITSTHHIRTITYY